MNVFRWMSLCLFCLFVSISGVRIYTFAQAHSAQSPTFVQVQTTSHQSAQSAINLLLQVDEEEQQPSLSTNLQSIIQLLLDDKEEARLFLPIVSR